MEEVLELRVAEVRMNLGGVLDAGSGKLEAVNGPLEVGVALRSLAKRKALLEKKLDFWDFHIGHKPS